METMNEIKKNAGILRMRAGGLLVYTLFTAIASGMAAKAEAQTFAEWFKQKSTQKKYLLQQIAALQVYGGYLKKGYEIAGHGFGSISGYLRSENGLHSGYYQKLETASPLVRNNPQVKEILAWQADIINRLSAMDAISGLSKDEKNYLADVRNAVLKDCDGQISQLQNVLTDGQLEMNDSERLGLIATIHRAMQENLRFASAFTEQVKIYALQRRKEYKDIAAGKALYTIH
ncbi:MAG: hypothetical protein JWR38_2824 [Mucilaginibacter sp.]|nr:hypothetical protein [Mucilaginibacter sp.]